jgi:hypothetical protein
MAIVLLRIDTITVDQIQMESDCACPKCGTKCKQVTTNIVKSVNIILPAKREQVVVTCNDCGKKIAGSLWDSRLAELVVEKKQQFKTTFFQRYGSLLIAAIIVLGGGLMMISLQHSDHKENIKNMQENFSKADSRTKNEQWLPNISTGDYLFASKSYGEPASLFKVKEIKADTIVLTIYEQTFEISEYLESDALNSLSFDYSPAGDYLVKTKDLITKGILEKVSAGMDTRDNLYIEQIKKNSQN